MSNDEQGSARSESESGSRGSGEAGHDVTHPAPRAEDGPDPSSGGVTRRPVGESAKARRNARRSRHRDEVFGNDLPDTTQDERGEDHNSISRSWYDEQRPPHYE
ncbi:hypothetical protein [Gordonia sp. NB41Y]|uniref:hypothetical protein n=1 Tax=Gordonia sp. NB41Y TaxID=875808 RepID=UPI0021C74CD0|nr:hypothetical protein [Gordonia sp. NB41Y]WLP91869.1 hypothetical protein Q9K23_06385 [Gordonia sp. NB41Y]